MTRDSILELAASDYHADKIDDRPSLNASIAKLLINASPRHARWAHPRLNPQFAPRAEQKFDVGTVVHRLLLEPEREQHVVVVEADSWRTKAAQEARDQAREDGDTPLLLDEWNRVQDMLTSVRDQIPLLDVSPIPFTDGKAEQTIVWEDPHTGVLCRARLDWLHNTLAVIDDIKSTKRSANPTEWARRALWAIGADVQVAAYKAAVRSITGNDPDFRFCVMETQPPFAISLVSLAPSALELGEAKWNAALDIWKRCVARNEWPGFTPRIVDAEAPTWAEMDFWDRQQLDEETVA